MSAPPPDRPRRSLLVAACGAALAVLSGPLAAQDPRSALAQTAARDWLVLTDRGDGAASWNAAGARFRNAAPADVWTPAMKQARDPLGAVNARSVQSTQFEKTFIGLPPGEYALVVFRSSFAKKSVARETVTLEREADGTWRVVGYVIG